jgi:arylsulfatase A-like enzyme
MGYERPTTPFLDSLASDNCIVPTAIVAGVPTYFSLPAILASRSPLSLGRDVLGLAPGEPTLASVLQGAGYATGCFAAANPYISPRFGYEQGFGKFRDFLENDIATSAAEEVNAKTSNLASRINLAMQKTRPVMGPVRRIYDDLYFEYCQRMTPVPASLEVLRKFPSADVIVDHAMEWISSLGDAPFFLWLHFMDPHSPYYPKHAALSSPGRTAVTPIRTRYVNSYWNRSDIDAGRLRKYRGEIIDLYDAGVRWVDEQLKRLIRFLEPANRWQDCVFVLTADHGEEFLDHGQRYHAPSHLAEELIRVPLLLRFPTSKMPEQAGSPFSLIHLAPTLLEFVRAPISVEFQGRSQLSRLLSGQGFDGPAISECVAGCTNPLRLESRNGSRILSVRESRYKLVLDFKRGTDRLYDLQSDPGEQSPLPKTVERVTRRRLLDASRQHLRQLMEHRDPRARLRARLRELQLEWPRS